MDKSVKYYILGLITGFIAIPFIEEFMDVVNSWIQVLILKPSKLVVKGNKELSDIQAESEPTDTHCIGFQYTGEDEYEVDDDEDF